MTMHTRTKGILISAAAAAVLVAAGLAVLAVSGTSRDTGLPGGTAQPAKTLPFFPAEHIRTDTLTKADLVAATGKIAGVFSPNSPYNNGEYDRYVSAAGSAPNALNLFTKWDSPFRADAADKSYARGAIPVVSWESWVDGSPADDANFTLASIAGGAHDDYVRTFAKDVAAYGKPVILRFDHEMNGSWYPWGSGVNGNTAEQYQASWRHVHDIFTEENATNAAWVWSANVVRAIPHGRVPLAGLYPGDDYVDYVGITGYDLGNEPDATALFQPTTDVVRAFTAKPFLLSEIGSVSFAGKSAFITSLFAYVASRPDVAGYIWFQTTTATGATGDYVFDDTAENAAAYAAGVATLPKIAVVHDVVEHVAYGDKPTVTPYTVKNSSR